MSEKMTCMPFGQLMDWILTEHKEKNTVFGVHRAYQADPSKNMEIFGRNPVSYTHLECFISCFTGI